MSILDRIGGPSAMAAAVDDFTRRILADHTLTPYFDGVGLSRLKDHQRAFLAAATGGPDTYLGRSLREEHARFEISPAHFDLAVAHLVDTLGDMGVSGATLDAIEARLASLKPEIAPQCTRPLAAGQLDRA